MAIQSWILWTSVTDSVNSLPIYIGPNLASATPTVNSAGFHSFLGGKDDPPITLQPTHTRELESTCSLFSPRKAPGYDNISMRVIKRSFHLISAQLANIFIFLFQKVSS